MLLSKARKRAQISLLTMGTGEYARGTGGAGTGDGAEGVGQGSDVHKVNYIRNYVADMQWQTELCKLHIYIYIYIL